MSAPANVDVLAVLDRWTHDWDDRELRTVRATVANLIAERDALYWALAQYPKRNTHRLQAQKICDGVAFLAVARVGGVV